MDRQHSADYALFETSWEVCNKVGGIYTVVSTKAKTLVEKLGDDYVLLGPWRLGDEQSEGEFEAEPGFETFTAACREMGVPTQVGRWKIPGAPRVILVEFSGLFERNDEILAELWEEYEVDSLTGGWEYVEPVLFGYAAGMVIERWYDEFFAPKDLPGVAQFHEWMTGAGLLYLKRHAPEIAHVFTTHATILGRSMAAKGRGPQLGLGGREAAQIAAELGVRSKHSMETVCARESDTFTTVSEITALEAELLLGRKPKPVLPNGIDLEVIDAISDGVDRDRSRAALSHLAHRFLGELDPDTAFLCISGRYEFHNKGIDMLLDALARMAQTPGRPVVLFATIPAGQSGVGNSLRERLEAPEFGGDVAPLGVSTHNLIDQANDPIQQAVKRLGLLNARGARVKVIQIPIYLSRDDDLLGFPYEGMLRGIDLTCFPSYYEPWGYTPEESLAAGVPTVTTDLAGFGRWVRKEGLTEREGVIVLDRDGVDDEQATEKLTAILEKFLASDVDPDEMARTCRRTALKTAWTDLVAHYYEAFDSAIEGCTHRRE
ncbi:MAG: glycosyltransferase, partial [Gemmatimonadetes bacterium]|nr:glycosyltransferase [Gemmatimonadota bacterium]